MNSDEKNGKTFKSKLKTTQNHKRKKSVKQIDSHRTYGNPYRKKPFQISISGRRTYIDYKDLTQTEWIAQAQLGLVEIPYKQKR